MCGSNEPAIQSCGAGTRSRPPATASLQPPTTPSSHPCRCDPPNTFVQLYAEAEAAPTFDADCTTVFAALRRTCCEQDAAGEQADAACKTAFPEVGACLPTVHLHACAMGRHVWVRTAVQWPADIAQFNAPLLLPLPLLPHPPLTHELSPALPSCSAAVRPASGRPAHPPAVSRAAGAITRAAGAAALAVPQARSLTQAGALAQTGALAAAAGAADQQRLFEVRPGPSLCLVSALACSTTARGQGHAVGIRMQRSLWWAPCCPQALITSVPSLSCF